MERGLGKGRKKEGGMVTEKGLVKEGGEKGWGMMMEEGMGMGNKMAMV